MQHRMQHTRIHGPTRTVSNMAKQWASLSSRRHLVSRYYQLSTPPHPPPPPPLHEPSNASGRFHNKVIIQVRESPLSVKCPSVLCRMA